MLISGFERTPEAERGPGDRDMSETRGSLQPMSGRADQTNHDKLQSQGPIVGQN